MTVELDDDLDVETSNLSNEKKLERFKSWYKLSTEAFAEQRKREEEDVAFGIPENQWLPGAKEERAGRPMIEISLLQGPLQLVYNQAAAAHFGVDLKPISEKAQTQTAEDMKGLYARIQRDGMADQARMWGFRRCEEVGIGWYRITTQFDEDSDNPSDQEIVYERLLYQEMVRPDPAAKKPDFSDGRFLFYGGYIPRRDAKRLGFKKVTADDFRDVAADEPEWIREGDVLVVECFYKETTLEEIAFQAATGPYKRQRERVRIRRAVMTGAEVAEDEEWLRDQIYIPFVPVIGEECLPIKGKRRWIGMVRNARGAQIEFNYANSQAIEDVSSSSKAKYLVAAGQVEGFKKDWDSANRSSKMYLEYNQLDSNGQQAPPPTLVQVDGTKMQLSMALAQQARELVQTATAGYEPLEVPKRKAEQSGIAIERLQQQTDAGRSHYLQNVKDITLPLDARIVLGMMPVVYDRPGRVMQVLGGEDESRPVMINRHYALDGNGKPVPVDPRHPEAKLFNLNAGGKYAIVPSIGKAPQTRLQEGQEFLTSVVQAAPELMGVIGDLLFAFRDEPGAKEIAERLKRQIAKTNPGILDDPQANSAEQAQQENQSLKQQLQALQQQAQEMQKMLETEQIKQQATIQSKQIETDGKVRMEEMRNATSILVARINAAKEAANATLEAQEERLATGLQIEHEASQANMDRAHEVGMAALGQAHAQDQAAMAGAQDQAMQAQAGAQDQQMQVGQQAHEADMTAQGQAHEANMQASDQAAAAEQAAQQSPDQGGA